MHIFGLPSPPSWVYDAWVRGDTSTTRQWAREVAPTTPWTADDLHTAFFDVVRLVQQGRQCGKTFALDALVRALAPVPVSPAAVALGREAVRLWRAQRRHILTGARAGTLRITVDDAP